MSAYFQDVVKKGRFGGEWNRWSSCSSYSADMLFKGEHRNIPSQLGVAKVNCCSAAADCSAALQREVFLYLKAASLWFLFNSSALTVQILLFRAMSCWAIYWFFFLCFCETVVLQIVHMGWACESSEGSAAGRTSVFKFLALRGPYFYIFRSPPVIRPDLSPVLFCSHLQQCAVTLISFEMVLSKTWSISHRSTWCALGYK